MSYLLIHLLLLLLVANGAPILARNLFGSHFATPVDFGFRLANNPLLGTSKTWRGLLASVLLTMLVAKLLGYSLLTGVIISVCAMTGDLLSSFIKRRLGMVPSSMAPLLDQIPESLLPALAMWYAFSLDWVSVMMLVTAFIVLELILSQVLYSLGLRNTPY